MEATIEVRGLRKNFGPTLALDDMTFTVAPGQVTGFIGPNGAGKTTTMRVILGLDAPDEGTAMVGGRRYAALHRPLTHLGSLLDAAALQPSRTGRNHLLWLAHSQGLDAARVDAVLGQAGLGKAARRKAGGYSLGMRQRLGIAAAILGDPPVLMMDEPFNGMDPREWRGVSIGAQAQEASSLPGRFRTAGGTFTVTGSGDIAPAGPGPTNIGMPADDGFVGAFAGLIVVIVVGAMFITAEYRRGLIAVTLAAAPGRGRVLAAKAIVIGSVTFVAGVVGAAPVIPVGASLLRSHGNYVFPMSALTEVRLIAGIAALLAISAILALAAGTILRHAAGAITAVIALIVVVYFFSVPLAVLPAGAADWLLRVTPAAGFAIQQYVPAYPQVNNVYSPQHGYFPLAPWAGLGVLCLWAAAALGLATVLLRRRDA
jgi:ABC-type Na+ transport system ATPase subunit NatA/ABC-type transport system involved in multi-copper enzyme maturation permease subunit